MKRHHAQDEITIKEVNAFTPALKKIKNYFNPELNLQYNFKSIFKTKEIIKLQKYK